MITIRKPDDFHVHARNSYLLTRVWPHTAKVFGRALVMPNTDPLILNSEDAKRYYHQIVTVDDSCEPLMTLYLTNNTTPNMIGEAFRAGVIAGKVYPVGVTTGSDKGVRNFNAMKPVFEAMEELGMVICFHGELPGVNVIEAEKAFLDILHGIATEHPQTKIVLEHVTTADAVDFVIDHHNVAATITAHHLVMTVDDWAGRPHNFCKPVAKFERDRARLLEAAGGGHKFFLGSDSAPHPTSHKEAPVCAAGCYTAPVLLPLLTQIFMDEFGTEVALEQFASVRGAEWYGLPLNEGEVTLVEDPWEVPNCYDGIVPFMAGETINWKVES
jgi:dihydroorotase